MKNLFLACAVLAATVAVSPTPAPTSTATAAPVRIALGENIEISGTDEPDANGKFHCDYVTPTMRVFLNLPQRIVWICGR